MQDVICLTHELLLNLLPESKIFKPLGIIVLSPVKPDQFPLISDRVRFGYVSWNIGILGHE